GKTTDFNAALKSFVEHNIVEERTVGRRREYRLPPGASLADFAAWPSASPTHGQEYTDDHGRTRRSVMRRDAPPAASPAPAVDQKLDEANPYEDWVNDNGRVIRIHKFIDPHPNGYRRVIEVEAEKARAARLKGRSLPTGAKRAATAKSRCKNRRNKGSR